MSNEGKAFEVDGISLKDGAFVFGGDYDPTVTGHQAPVGSYFFRGNGTQYKKTGAGDTDWTFSLGEVTITEQGTIHVDLSGNDTTGDGSLANPFRTINKAAAVAPFYSPSAFNPIIIRVGPGVYVEVPFTVVSHVSIRCTEVVIFSANPTVDLITLNDSADIFGAVIGGTTTAGKYDVRVVGVANGTVNLQECIFGNGSTGGVICTSTGANFTPVINNCAFYNFTETGLRIESNCDARLTNMGMSGIFGVTAVGIETAGDAKAILGNVEIGNCTKGIRHNSTGTFRMPLVIIQPTCTIPVEKIGLSPVIASPSSEFVGESLVGTDITDLFGAFTDVSQGSRSLRVADALAVGLPGRGVSSTFGEGPGYVNGMLVYGYDGATFTSNTAAARDTGGATFSFPGTAAGNMLYFTTLRADTIDKLPLPFYGLEISQDTAATGGTLVVEFWNGTAWASVNHMSRREGGDKRPFADALFRRTGDEHISFDRRITNTWVRNDPVGLGIATFWVRVRISSALTVNPVFSKTRITPSGTEISADGFVEFFGRSRPLNILPFDTSTFLAADSSPGNADVYFGKSVSVGRGENSFAKNVSSRAGVVLPFPYDMDTSCPVIARFHFFSTSNSTAPVNFTLRYANSKITDIVNTSPGPAPTLAPRQVTLFNVYTPPAANANKVFVVEFTLDVASVVTSLDSGAGDLFWLNIERDGSTDTNPDTMVMVQLEIFYQRWCNGGHQ